MLSIIILSLNRLPILRRTLRELDAIEASRVLDVRLETIVVDNASTDGTPIMVSEEFPRVRVLSMDSNLGVEAFNRGVLASNGDVVLILDDDAWPDGPSLAAAVNLLRSNSRTGAVALSPVHPADGVCEWRYLTEGRGQWPTLGCGNLVRTSAWREVGGYEASFFLYRNDTDLALKLLGAGWDVHADPDWIVWHNSPHAASKSLRWLLLATRNWVLLTRRHARGWRLPAAILLGWAWALRLAGWNPIRLREATRGLLSGIGSSPAPLPASIEPDGRAFAELLRLQLSSRRTRTTARRPAPLHTPDSISSVSRHSA